MLTDHEIENHSKELYKYATEIMGLESNEATVCLAGAIGMIIRDCIKDPKNLEKVMHDVQNCVLLGMK